MSEPIKCLGKTFPSEDERRDYFRNELRKLLPELKKVDGFPIGDDEDIVGLSDPPYFTLCPNPWLNDFIYEWEREKVEMESNGYRFANFPVTEPYASDISEGKNNPIYNAHSYHTKVPHPVIMRYILHYTQPGDIILDGFAGTGMTGVAAQLCGKPDSETKYKIEKEYKELGVSPPTWGSRWAICGDLSPIATFISKNYNTKHKNIQDVLSNSEKLLQSIENEFSWIYETKHSETQTGKINNIVWSEIFKCPECNNEIIYFDVAVDEENGEVKDEFYCSSCSSKLTKSKCESLKSTVWDSVLKKTVSQPKYAPVKIKYVFRGKRYEKKPDKFDISLIDKIDKIEIDIPTYLVPVGDKTNEFIRKGYTHFHQCYFMRSLLALNEIKSRINKNDYASLLIFTSICQTLSSRLVRYNMGNRGNGPMTGTIYVPSLIAENNVFNLYEGKTKDFIKAYGLIHKTNPQRTASATDFSELKSNSIDYIFVDPPFGANLMYSDLNYLWESWLRVFTNTKDEAIENKTQGKSTLDYQNLMAKCFREYHRVLKPDKWMTVEFSNTNAAVWNGIQTAIQRAGFVISNVAALDKKQGSFNAVTNPTSVKQDLIISCYKPSEKLQSIFAKSADINLWDFVSEHLQHLPIHLFKGSDTTLVIERSAKILYDRLISYYIIHGHPVPIDAKEFHEGLTIRFVERDGMYFTNHQIVEYDEKKAMSPNVIQVSWQIASEEEGIEWLKRELRGHQLKYQDIMPRWMQAITAVRKGDILPELRDLLQQNFIEEQDGSWRVPNMNEAKDREAMRNKILLREFNDYVEISLNPKAKKMKEVRVEALHAGFKKCWEAKDFETIVRLSEKIPQNVLLEDEQLLMYYDIAKDKV